MANSRRLIAAKSDADKLRDKIRERHQLGLLTTSERGYLLKELDKGTPVKTVSQMIKSLVGM